MRKQALKQGLAIDDIGNIVTRTSPHISIPTDNKTPMTDFEGGSSVQDAVAMVLLCSEATLI
jgi:hypothetical protein